MRLIQIWCILYVTKEKSVQLFEIRHIFAETDFINEHRNNIHLIYNITLQHHSAPGRPCDKRPGAYYGRHFIQKGFSGFF